MTACDLGAITKPWPVQKKVARLVAVEFFQQGDLERRELKVEPIDMMNREKIENLPSMQVDFINAICTPIYKSFNQFSEGALQPMVEGVNLNHIQWSKLADSKASVWSEDEEEDEIQDMAAAWILSKVPKFHDYSITRKKTMQNALAEDKKIRPKFQPDELHATT